MKISFKLSSTDTSGLDSCNTYAEDDARDIMQAYADEVAAKIQEAYPDAYVEAEMVVGEISPIWTTTVEFDEDEFDDLREEIDTEKAVEETVDGICEAIGQDGDGSEWANVARRHEASPEYHKKHLESLGYECVGVDKADWHDYEEEDWDEEERAERRREWDKWPDHRYFVTKDWTGDNAILDWDNCYETEEEAWEGIYESVRDREEEAEADRQEQANAEREEDE